MKKKVHEIFNTVEYKAVPYSISKTFASDGFYRCAFRIDPNFATAVLNDVGSR